MLPYRDSRLTIIALIVFFLILAGYGYFELRGMLFGPAITVTSNVTEVTQPFITITGHAERISSLAMNGKEIPVTEDGSFEASYLLAPGYNRIVLDAHDKYERSAQRAIEIVYTPEPQQISLNAATTTAATSSAATSTPR